MQNKERAESWFEELRDKICYELEKIEKEVGSEAKFKRKKWLRNDDEDQGGGEISVMYGGVFEKVGVNISTVYGEFSEEFREKIPGAEKNGKFWATGVSFVSHPKSPLVPIAHFNTRFIVTEKSWFGGGGDLTPVFPEDSETKDFHQAFKNVCDKYDSEYYAKYKKWCDEYFYLPHRNESRGVGGIFYDYLEGDFSNNFSFTEDVGKAFLEIYPKIVRKKYKENWNEAQKEEQLKKRGRYVEFNLLHDRGTKFGLSTNGNIEAILMSLPPVASWK